MRMGSIDRQDADIAAFERAMAHSKRVGLVKRVLPAIAVAALLLGGAAIIVSENAPDVSVSLPDSTISDGKLVMANPKLDGFTSDRKPYRVTANRAVQDLAGDKPIELETLRADVELRDGKTARLVSKTGSFDSTTSILVLPERAVLTMSDGTEAILGSADIDIQTGEVKASNQVQITSEGSRITAMKMQVSGNGDMITFEDQVRVVLTPSAVGPASTDANN